MRKKSAQQGVTMIELITALGIIMILVTSSIIIINPEEKRMRARDNKRLTDISTLDRAVNEYLLDNGGYPDLPDILRESTTLPAGSSALDQAEGGWIAADLSDYASRLPIDPINDTNYFYSYYHTTSGYEINALLEYLSEVAQDDGGDDPVRFEQGNNLTLISP